MKVYVATSIPLYNYPEYETVLKPLVERLYPDCEILYAKGMFANSDQWIAQLPLLLDWIDVVIFFTDSTGYIGKGVYTEIEGALARGKQVFYVTWEGEQTPVESLTSGMFEVYPQNWKFYARITNGQPASVKVMLDEEAIERAIKSIERKYGLIPTTKGE